MTNFQHCLEGGLKYFVVSSEALRVPKKRRFLLYTPLFRYLAEFLSTNNVCSQLLLCEMCSELAKTGNIMQAFVMF